MHSRCPFLDCSETFDIEESEMFGSVTCPACMRQVTARSLERHLAIDKVKEKHRRADSLATPELIALRWGSAPSGRPRFTAMLEDVRSLWNVGSMFRTSDGAGFSHLFLLGITGYPPRNEIAKTSLGAESVIGWHYAGSAVEIAEALKQHGYQLISLEKSAGSICLKSAMAQNLIRPPLCLIVGNEVTGIYKETLDTSDLVVHLPMRGMKNSLNVAVAFGIASYTIAEAFMPAEETVP